MFRSRRGSNRRAGLALVLAGVGLAGVPQAAEAAARDCTVITHRAIYKNTEEQPIGVKVAARWGWAEVDAAMTKDGKIVAIHDPRLTRITGGESHALVEELTLSEIRELPYEFGRRVQTTARLIRKASKHKSRIMVTINGYGRVKEQWEASGFDKLWNAAQRHRRTKHVYFGGYGAGKAMREAHPRASSFHRYEGDTRGIGRHAKDSGIDIAVLPRPKFDRPLVRRLKRNGILVATEQLTKRRHVRQANRKGIRIIQSDHARRTARKWCLPR